MAFTKAEYEEVKEMVVSGQIEAARRMLERIDDDKARVMLEKLNQRYPFTLADAKRLLGEQRYEEAEKILWNLDDPEATALLEKLTLVKTRMKATGTAPAVTPSARPGTGSFATTKAKTKTQTPFRSSQSSPLSLGMIVTLGGSVILVILVALLIQVIQQRQRPTAIQTALKEVCIKFSRVDPQPGQEDLTDEQIAADCGAAAQELYDKSPDVVNTCYDLVGDKTDALEWSACLSDRLDFGDDEDAQQF